ncbi:MAG: hypothetical protein KF691_12125 [Phycisphaeraceae bacterium]|nr:hypothetical protein [Phycisphaeraceae bacterium]
MTEKPTNPGNARGPSEHLDVVARRVEGRQLIQAFLDGDISAQSPKLRALLASDEQLRQELEDFQQLGEMLRSPSPSSDLSAQILAELQDRPVFLPAPLPRRSVASSIGVRIAAALALCAGVMWISLAALRNPIPTQSIAQTDLVSDARQAIRNTTGSPVGNPSQHSYVIAPVAETSIVPDIESIVMTRNTDPRAVANQMAGTGAVRIERTGLSFVNPGPDRFANSNQSRRARAAVLQWNTQPDAMYSGGKFQRSDVYRAAAATGRQKEQSSYVPVAGPARDSFR